MKSTHFPLLRSSPAVGTGSYGALPSPSAGDINSYATSSLSASTASEEVEGWGHDNDDDDTGGLAPPRLRERGKRKAASVQDDDTGVQDKSREASGTSPLLGHAPDLESEYEHREEEEEEEDEDDNSP